VAHEMHFTAIEFPDPISRLDGVYAIESGPDARIGRKSSGNEWLECDGAGGSRAGDWLSREVLGVPGPAGGGNESADFTVGTGTD
jgi:hypothetical protein